MKSKETVCGIGKSLRSNDISTTRRSLQSTPIAETFDSRPSYECGNDDVRSKISNASMLFGIQGVALAQRLRGQLAILEYVTGDGVVKSPQTTEI